MAGKREKEPGAQNFRGFHLQSHGKKVSNKQKKQNESMIPGDVCYLQHSGFGKKPI